MKSFSLMTPCQLAPMAWPKQGFKERRNESEARSGKISLRSGLRPLKLVTGS